jgi:hypothetical protein
VRSADFTAAFLAVAVPVGMLAGVLMVVAASRIPRLEGPVGVRIRVGGRSRYAPLACASLIPVVAAAYSAAPKHAAVATFAGWVLLAIAVCDEEALRIPNLLWSGGAVIGTVVAWYAGGWHGAFGRGAGMLLVMAGLLAASRMASQMRGRVSIGAADYGVLGFIAILCGPWVTLDVLLVAGVAALGRVAPASSHRGANAFLLLPCLCAVAFGGAAGAAAGAIVMAFPAVSAVRSGRNLRPAPFGACLSLACFVVCLGTGFPAIADRSPVRADFVLHHIFTESR